MRHVSLVFMYLYFKYCCVYLRVLCGILRWPRFLKQLFVYKSILLEFAGYIIKEIEISTGSVLISAEFQ